MSNNAIINFLFNSQGAVNQLNNFRNKFSEAISSIEQSGIGKFAAIGSTIASIFSVRDITKHAKLIGDFQQKAENMSLEEASLFSNLFELKGGTDVEAIQALDQINTLIKDLEKNGGPETLRGLISPFDTMTGKLKNSVQFLEEFREKYQRGVISKKAMKDNLTQMGIYSEAMREYMELRGEERAEYERKAERMGVVSPDMIKRMKDMTESVANLRASFRRLGDTLMKAGIGDLIDKITAAINRFCELPETTQQAVLGLIVALLLLPPAFKILKSSWIFFGIFSSPAAKGIKLVARAVLALSLALGVTSLLGLGFIGFIGAVIVNMGGLRDALDNCLKSFDRWIYSIGQDHPMLASFMRQLSELANAILHPIETFKKAWNQLVAITGWGTPFEIDEYLETTTLKNEGDTRGYDSLKMTPEYLSSGVENGYVNPEDIQNMNDAYAKFAASMNDLEAKNSIEEKKYDISKIMKDLQYVVSGENGSGDIGIKNETVAPELLEMATLTKGDDNRSFTLTFNANFSNMNPEYAEEVEKSFKEWGKSVDETLKEYVQNDGGSM